MKRSTNVRPTDDELMDAMLPTIAERSCAAVSMDELAARANSTKQTLYAHFGSKDALLARMQDREYTDLRERLLAAYADITPDQDLQLVITAATDPLYEYATARPDGVRLLLDETAPGYPDRAAAFYAALVAAVVDKTTTPDLPEAALTVIGHMNVAAAAAGNRAVLTGPLDRELGAALTTAFIAGGIRSALAVVATR